MRRLSSIAGKPGYSGGTENVDPFGVADAVLPAFSPPGNARLLKGLFAGHLYLVFQFNPHPKIFRTAPAGGVSGRREYLDVELKRKGSLDTSGEIT